MSFYNIHGDEHGLIYHLAPNKHRNKEGILLRVFHKDNFSLGKELAQVWLSLVAFNRYESYIIDRAKMLFEETGSEKTGS